MQGITRCQERLRTQVSTRLSYVHVRTLCVCVWIIPTWQVYQLSDSVLFTFSLLCVYGCLHYKTQNGVTALLLAVKKGHVNVVSTLLKHGARVDMKNLVSAQPFILFMQEHAMC